MAFMIPAECDPALHPASEQIVFHAVKEKVSDEWTVFHSFDYIQRGSALKLQDGEIDFLFYHPALGILVLEVKGGQIGCQNGLWRQNGHPTDPVEQAKKNKYAVRDLLEKKLGRAVPLRFAHAVCFPDCGFRETWPAEAAEIVLTGTGLPYLETFLKKTLNAVYLPPALSSEPLPARDEVLSVLAPNFEYGSTLGERIGSEERCFFLFTERQCSLLSALVLMKRLRIRGCAGSGKTVMAVKKAKMLAEEGKNVLLLCFNQMLAEHLQAETRGFPTIHAAAFFEYCIRLLKIKETQIEKYRANPKLYTDVLPHLLNEYCARFPLAYDAVIVDEGQDFSKEAWQAIALLPKEDGCFYVFYDPDQNIFHEDLNLPDFGPDHTVLLDKNCRNTKNIFAVLRPFVSMSADVLEAAPDGAEVRTLTGDCPRLLEVELDRLVNAEFVPPHRIVILGAHALKNTSLAGRYAENETESESLPCGKFRIVPRKAVPGRLEVSYYTYMKFKGCEADVVILLDVSETDPRWSDAHGKYAAMSRAVHQLILLHVR